MIPIKLKILIVLMLVGITNNAQTWAWKKEMNGNFAPDQIQYSPGGKLLLAGSYKSSFSIDAVNYTDPGITNSCGFLAKFDTSGACQWQNPIYVAQGCYTPNGNTYRKFFKVSVMTEDSQGNSYIGGWYEGCSCNFGNGVILNGAGQGMFLAKFNSTGQCQWAKLLNEASDGQGNLKGQFYGISVDMNDNIYLSQSKYLFPQTFLGLTYNSRNSYLLKMDGNGNGLWLKQTSNTTYGYGINSIKVVGNKIFSLGNYIGPATLAAQSYTSAGSTDMLVLVLDTAGNELAANVINGAGTEDATKLIITSDNKLVILGNTSSNNLTLGTSTLNTDASHSKYFMAAYDTNLNLLNYKNLGDNNTCQAIGTMANDYFGNFYMVCSHSVPTLFDNFYGSNTGTSIIKYNSSLQAQWLSGTGGGLVVDNVSNLYTIKYTDVTTNFGPFEVTASTGNEKIVLAKIASGTLGLPTNSKQATNLNIFPNPSKGGLYNVLLPNAINNVATVKLKLYNNLGQQLQILNYNLITTTTINFSINNLPEGVYELKIEVDDLVYKAKIVK